MRPARAPARQRGVALITVLLVFALVAIVAAEMLRRSQLNLRSVGNLIETRQAYYYALGGEAYARQLLALDVRDGHGDKDLLSEPWAQTDERETFEIEQGEMVVTIRDLQGRLNLNGIVDQQGQLQQGGLAQLQRLLDALNLDPAYAQQWQDWLDKDQVRQPSGAEDADYPDYRTAGGWEADISALRLLRTMRAEDFDKLAPHVTVLPAPTAINVNTADRTVLRALSPIMSESRAAQVVARQQAGGYADTAAFLAAMGAAGSIDADDVAVQSDFFEVLVTVKYQRRLQRLRTVLQRDNKSGALTVISRERGPLIDEGQADDSRT
jgi:general secretion pathway protein K